MTCETTDQLRLSCTEEQLNTLLFSSVLCYYFLSFEKHELPSKEAKTSYLDVVAVCSQYELTDASCCIDPGPELILGSNAPVTEELSLPKVMGFVYSEL